MFNFKRAVKFTLSPLIILGIMWLGGWGIGFIDIPRWDCLVVLFWIFLIFIPINLLLHFLVRKIDDKSSNALRITKKGIVEFGVPVSLSLFMFDILSENNAEFSYIMKQLLKSVLFAVGYGYVIGRIVVKKVKRNTAEV